MQAITIHFDGSCWPNPDGCATAGVYIKDGTATLLKEGFFVGDGEGTSNNVAEYAGLIRALEFLKANALLHREIIVYGDSKLVILQLRGRWKIKRGLYKESALQAKALVKQFSNISFRWIPRDENVICDSLAEEALQERDPDSVFSQKSFLMAK